MNERIHRIHPITSADLDRHLQPTGQILQLHIELEHIVPTVWRRIAVLDTISLKKLHSVIQAAMGWKNCHLHDYQIGDRPFPKQAPLVQLLEYAQRHHQALTYTYDPGDCWRHRITLEQPLAPENLPHLPYCLDGANACPPEDTGGIFCYPNFLEAITTPGHPEHRAMLDWHGGPFDPEAYDRDASNRRMKRIKLASPA